MKSNIYASARNIFLAVFLTLFLNSNLSAQQFLTTIDGWNAYVHLPDDYTDSTAKNYPLICFIPGTGECGTNPASLLTYGPSKYVNEGHNMKFMVNGKIEKPIVISLQPISLWPSAYTLNRKLDTIFARYRCDQQRINVTGLSMGGWSWDNYVDNYSPTYTNRITSIVSMSAPEPDNTVSNMRFYAIGGGTMWSFEGDMDLRGNDKIRDTMNKYVPGSNRYTLYSGGHCCWNTFYNPTWVENGESIYTWMLKQHRLLIAGPSSPQAYAGNDSSILSVASNVPLKGVGNDPNGLPINFTWTKVSGPLNGSIVSPTALQTNVSGLVQGTYKFELKVVNSVGLIGKDTILINNGNQILPVILTDFSAKQVSTGGVYVQWNTSSEINSDYYVVERSGSSQIYSEAAKISSVGSANLGKTYSFSDNLPLEGANFYRLKIVDKDGSFSYSRIVSVSVKDASTRSLVILSGILRTDLLQMIISSSKSQPGNIFVVDANGKKIFSASLSLSKGNNSLKKSLNLAKGIYYARLSTDTEKITRVLIRE